VVFRQLHKKKVVEQGTLSPANGGGEKRKEGTFSQMKGVALRKLLRLLRKGKERGRGGRSLFGGRREPR